MTEIRSWLPGADEGGMGDQLQKAEESFGGVEIFYLDCGSGYTACTFVETHQTMHLK